MKRLNEYKDNYDRSLELEEILIDSLGYELLCEELFKALNKDTLVRCLEYIARNHDINVDFDEENGLTENKKQNNMKESLSSKDEKIIDKDIISMINRVIDEVSEEEKLSKRDIINCLNEEIAVELYNAGEGFRCDKVFDWQDVISGRITREDVVLGDDEDDSEGEDYSSAHHYCTIELSGFYPDTQRKINKALKDSVFLFDEIDFEKNFIIKEKDFKNLVKDVILNCKRSW